MKGGLNSHAFYVLDMGEARHFRNCFISNMTPRTFFVPHMPVSGVSSNTARGIPNSNHVVGDASLLAS